MSKAPFGQTSSRFHGDRHVKYLPGRVYYDMLMTVYSLYGAVCVGPGAYNDSTVTSMATELAKRSMWVSTRHSITWHTCRSCVCLYGKGLWYVLFKQISQTWIYKEFMISILHWCLESMVFIGIHLGQHLWGQPH